MKFRYHCFVTRKLPCQVSATYTAKKLPLVEPFTKVKLTARGGICKAFKVTKCNFKIELLH